MTFPQIGNSETRHWVGLGRRRARDSQIAQATLAITLQIHELLDCYLLDQRQSHLHKATPKAIFHHHLLGRVCKIAGGGRFGKNILGPVRKKRNAHPEDIEPERGQLTDCCQRCVGNGVSLYTIAGIK